MSDLNKGLYIVATPIGNLEDFSEKTKNILNMADFIICENPVHSLKLLNKLGIKKKLLSLHDYNENILIKRIEKYQKNSLIALISDAGSPLISDPGYNLVLDYINKGLLVTSIPGPSSIISALQLAGLPSNRFSFLGFVSKSNSAISNLIEEIKNQEMTAILFISGIRLLNFLDLLIKSEFNRNISVCKELNKKNERVFRGGVKKIIEEISVDKKLIKGEFVIVLEGKDKKTLKALDPEINDAIARLLNKFSLTEVVEIVHKLTKISKKEIYKKALIIKND